ncbi:MAG: hypothetical protein EHM20_01490 [Alphaproteobacteria bacterium]|nr:MAG: hypothetical protein EHM20_01490 [Alphaproteobacteria bacterium]
MIKTKLFIESLNIVLAEMKKFSTNYSVRFPEGSEVDSLLLYPWRYIPDFLIYSPDANMLMKSIATAKKEMDKHYISSKFITIQNRIASFDVENYKAAQKAIH